MPSKSKLWAVAAMAVAAVCIFVAMKIADYAGGLDLVNAWTKDVGVLGMVLFALLSGISVVFFFPGSILMTASGAAFGLRDGFVVALVATSVGAALAFLASRYLARKRVEEWVALKPRFAAVDNAIGHEGWKIVVLTRCCPLFPYIFQNYAYGSHAGRLRPLRFGLAARAHPLDTRLRLHGLAGRGSGGWRDEFARTRPPSTWLCRDSGREHLHHADLDAGSRAGRPLSHDTVTRLLLQRRRASRPRRCLHARR